MTRRIVHLSDLHFGRDRPELVGPLLETVNAMAPDLVAISGDMTQRARPREYRDARRFIDGIVPPVLVVPGNHDVPLDNLFMRLLLPWKRYGRAISRDRHPVFRDAEMTVIGLNTVTPWSWQRGRLSRRALARACAAFAPLETPRIRIVVAHHPMEHAPGEKKELMHGARRAVEELSGCGADAVLSGHLHSWRADAFAAIPGHRAALQIHAGTGLSTRVRGEENDFNLLTCTPDRITVARHAAGEGAAAFAVVGEVSFDRTAHGWAPA